jgi:hypothetical protein
LPIDFGSTGVTGMHATCVAALRRHFGLENRPVKVHEPYQMLGLLEDDLQSALGLDVEGVFPRKTMFGFSNHDWKPWRMPDGLEVLVSEDFRVTVRRRRQHSHLSRGRHQRRAQRPHAARWLFLRLHHAPATPIDEERLNPDDNLEEFAPIADDEVEYFRQEVERAFATGRAVMANFGGTAFGDIALVPGPFLKHPKGIRDVAEWYMATSSRRDYIHRIFDRQCDIAIGNLARIHAAVGDAVDAVFICGTDFGSQTSAFCSAKSVPRALFPVLPPPARLDPQEQRGGSCFKHSCGSVVRGSFPRSSRRGSTF